MDGHSGKAAVDASSPPPDAHTDSSPGHSEGRTGESKSSKVNEYMLEDDAGDETSTKTPLKHAPETMHVPVATSQLEGVNNEDSLTNEADIPTSSRVPNSDVDATESQGDDSHPEIIQFEHAAEQVKSYAMNLHSKISAALNSDSDPTRDARADVTAGLGSLATNIGNWWTSFEIVNEVVNDKAPVIAESTNSYKAPPKVQPEEELAQTIELDEGDNLVEQFKCKMLQTYTCSHNSFTPDMQMTFAGTMSITDQHVCFIIQDRGKNLPFKFAYTQVVSASRVSGGIMKLVLDESDTVLFKDFPSKGEFESAIAYVEHLMSVCKT